MFKGYALFFPFLYAFSSNLSLLLFFLSIVFTLPFLKLFPFFQECLRRSTFLPPTHSLLHGLKEYYRNYDTERGEDKHGANGRREKPKVKGRSKGEDRSVKGKKGDKARNSDPIK
jgi:hypothetical protein